VGGGATFFCKVKGVRVVEIRRLREEVRLWEREKFYQIHRSEGGRKWLSLVGTARTVDEVKCQNRGREGPTAKKKNLQLTEEEGDSQL